MTKFKRLSGGATLIYSAISSYRFNLKLCYKFSARISAFAFLLLSTSNIIRQTVFRTTYNLLTPTLRQASKDKACK